MLSKPSVAGKAQSSKKQASLFGFFKKVETSIAKDVDGKQSFVHLDSSGENWALDRETSSVDTMRTEYIAVYEEACSILKVAPERCSVGRPSFHDIEMRKAAHKVAESVLNNTSKYTSAQDVIENEVYEAPGVMPRLMFSMTNLVSLFPTMSFFFFVLF